MDKPADTTLTILSWLTQGKESHVFVFSDIKSQIKTQEKNVTHSYTVTRQIRI